MGLYMVCFTARQNFQVFDEKTNVFVEAGTKKLCSFVSKQKMLLPDQYLGFSPNCFVNISATIYHSEAVLYSKQKGGFPLRDVVMAFSLVLTGAEK